MSLHAELTALLALASEAGLTRASEYLSVHTRKEMGAPRHMWEVDHPYYCSESHFYLGEQNSCHYTNWAAFLEEEGGNDMDLNLIFRWDWRCKEGEWGGDVQDKLYLFWATQRKGYFRVSTIDVDKKDEPAVRDWLAPRFDRLMQLWEPFTWVDDELPEMNYRTDDTASKFNEGADDRLGTCDSCESPGVWVTPYEMDSYYRRKESREFETNGKTKVWYCKICANTHASTFHQYPEQHSADVHSLAKMVGRATNAILAEIKDMK